MHGSYHWMYERYVSIALVPLIGFPLIAGPSKTCDFLLGVALPIHCHMGFGQVVNDYLNPSKIGSVANKGVMGALYGATALTMYGLYKFNTQDVGITEFVRNLWRGPETKQ